MIGLLNVIRILTCMLWSSHVREVHAAYIFLSSDIKINLFCFMSIISSPLVYRVFSLTSQNVYPNERHANPAVCKSVAACSPAVRVLPQPQQKPFQSLNPGLSPRSCRSPSPNLSRNYWIPVWTLNSCGPQDYPHCAMFSSLLENDS